MEVTDTDKEYDYNPREKVAKMYEDRERDHAKDFRKEAEHQSDGYTFKEYEYTQRHEGWPQSPDEYECGHRASSSTDTKSMSLDSEVHQ